MTIDDLLKSAHDGERLSHDDIVRLLAVPPASAEGMRTIAAGASLAREIADNRAEIQAGLGWSVVSRRSVEAELADGRLEEVPVRGLRMRRSFLLVTHGRRSLPAPYRAFVDHLAAAGR